MTREHKLALIVGFSLVLVLGVLISDHFSKARTGAPLAVEIKEPASTPFSATIASTGSQSPNAQLPLTRPAPQQPAAPTGGGGRTLEPLPGTGSPVSTPPQSPTTIAMGDSARGANMPTTPLSEITQTPIAGGAGSSLPPSSGALKHYDVKENDNAYSIAKKFYGEGNLWTRLRDFNKGKITESGGMRECVTLDIPPRDVLDGKARLGDVRAVLVNQPAVPGVASETTRADPGSAKSAVAGATYTVQEGDTLYSIARKKLGGGGSAERVQELVDLNKSTLSSADDLKAGMILRLPTR